MNEEKKTCVKRGQDEPHSFNSFIDPERTHECGHPGCMCREGAGDRALPGTDEGEKEMSRWNDLPWWVKERPRWLTPPKPEGLIVGCDYANGKGDSIVVDCLRFVSNKERWAKMTDWKKGDVFMTDYPLDHGGSRARNGRGMVIGVVQEVRETDLVPYDIQKNVSFGELTTNKNGSWSKDRCAKIGEMPLEALPDYEKPSVLPRSVLDKIEKGGFGEYTPKVRDLMEELYKSVTEEDEGEEKKP